MAPDLIELLESNSRKTDRILLLLEGDEFQMGLIPQVRKNAEDIETLKRLDAHSADSTSTLAGVALLFFFLAPALIFIDRMFLISEIREYFHIYGYWAVLASSVLGLLAQGMAIFVVLVLTLRWVGWNNG